MDYKNTVPAVNQMINSSEVSFLGNENAKTRILVLGNSITRHGPKKEIGWNGDWGMAASAPEKDYVHRLYAKLTENGQDVFMRIRQASYWETHFLDDDVLSRFQDDRDFGADIVVFRLGDNSGRTATGKEQAFEKALETFISYLSPSAKKVVYTTCFYVIPHVDAAIQSVAQKRGEVCISANLSLDETNRAIGLFEHSGVAGHPSDKGMEELASLIFKELKE